MKKEKTFDEKVVTIWLLTLLLLVLLSIWGTLAGKDARHHQNKITKEMVKYRKEVLLAKLKGFNEKPGPLPETNEANNILSHKLNDKR